MTDQTAAGRWTVVVSDDPDQRLAAFRRRFEEVARTAIDGRGRFTVALTGGSTVPTYYPSLRGAAVDWSRVDVLFGDERAVGPAHPDSNHRANREALLDAVAIPADRVHRIEGELADPAEAARRYAGVLADLAGTPPVIDLVHLGVGPDGHVASLFPGHPALDETDRTVVAVADAPKPPPRRITLTMPVLIAARELWLFATGDNKTAVFREAANDPRSPLPLARVLRAAPSIVVFADEANAAAFPPSVPRM